MRVRECGCGCRCSLFALTIPPFFLYEAMNGMGLSFRPSDYPFVSPVVVGGSRFGIVVVVVEVPYCIVVVVGHSC